jgi:NAD(P)-dependent dehydrogenase (short-subunit alcohol dehydrogenase family)
MERFARESAPFALRRGGDVDEIFGAALYLACDASFTTGALLRVDGGYSWRRQLRLERGERSAQLT